jgi:hypothetical protein
VTIDGYCCGDFYTHQYVHVFECFRQSHRTMSNSSANNASGPKPFSTSTDLRRLAASNVAETNIDEEMAVSKAEVALRRPRVPLSPSTSKGGRHDSSKQIYQNPLRNCIINLPNFPCYNLELQFCFLLSFESESEQ